MTRVQSCTLCDKPSIPGLRPGAGKCEFHWVAGVWGEEWAKKALARVVSNDEALTRIQLLMSGQEWSADTLDDIAEVMRDAGYEIKDTNESEDE